MRADERLGLARQAYQRALAGARMQSTRTSWLRLLTASRNLKSATTDDEKERPPRPPPRSPAGQPAAPDGAPRTGSGPEPAGRVLKLPRPVQLGLAREWERARVLRKRARVLVREACLLREEIARLAQRWTDASPVDG